MIYISIMHGRTGIGQAMKNLFFPCVKREIFIFVAFHLFYVVFTRDELRWVVVCLHYQIKHYSLKNKNTIYMEASNKTKVTIEATIKAHVDKVWKYWNEPEHIVQWAF